MIKNNLKMSLSLCNYKCLPCSELATYSFQEFHILIQFANGSLYQSCKTQNSCKGAHSNLISSYKCQLIQFLHLNLDIHSAINFCWQRGFCSHNFLMSHTALSTKHLEDSTSKLSPHPRLQSYLLSLNFNWRRLVHPKCTFLITTINQIACQNLHSMVASLQDGPLQTHVHPNFHSQFFYHTSINDV